MLSVLPYIRDVLRRKSKPNIVSWATWTLLLGIGSAAAFAAHQPRSALLTLGDAIATFSVVVLGLRFGIAKLSRFDAICQVAAITGLILWALFNSPAIDIIFAIVVDFAVSLPTLRHSWLKSFEETWQTYAASSVAGVFTLASLNELKFSGWAFPLYLLLINAILAITIIVGRRRLKTGVK